VNYYLDAMRKYVTFSGRATRSQFWIFLLVFMVLFLVAMAIDFAIGIKMYNIGVLTIVVSLVHILPIISIYVRRLHDINKSGWWYWITLVPAVGPILLLVYTCTGSKNEGNIYGTPVVA
jgi:uncharacterized membrane protein YhaH (DUF805 family)